MVKKHEKKAMEDKVPKKDAEAGKKPSPALLPTNTPTEPNWNTQLFKTMFSWQTRQ